MRAGSFRPPRFTEDFSRTKPTVVHHDPPVEQPDADFPLVLTTGRRLESYNSGVQTAGYDSPLHKGESLDISPEDAAHLGIGPGDLVRIESRRGRVEAPARIDDGLRAGVVFMTLHFPDDVPTNMLTIDVSDPKSGTAEFKACAVRVTRVIPAATVPMIGSARGRPGLKTRPYTRGTS